MIIWLASFPRSGNTLLRTVLNQCLGVSSWSEGKGQVALTDTAKGIFGHQELDFEWNEFYRQATNAENIYLVKTHLFPCDNQKAIYVVRDGRQTLVSYYHYHKEFLGDQKLSLLQLILGLDYYGGWSEHYRVWVESRPKTLVVHYKDLVNGNPEIIKILAEFIGKKERCNPWKNPFDLLKKENPNFFRKGTPLWEDDPIWNEYHNSIFYEIHGDLMELLGYADSKTVNQARAGISQEVKELVAIITRLNNHKRDLQRVCDERFQVIQTLEQVCDERLALIERISNPSITQK